MTDAQTVERRDHERHALPLHISMADEEEGAVHDLSPNGILYESASQPVVGSQVHLNLQYSAGSGFWSLACDGQVVRVERAGESFNIAVRLGKPLFG